MTDFRGGGGGEPVHDIGAVHTARMLSCPSCGSEIKSPSNLRHAVARCRCRAYPCLEGVIVADVAVREPLVAAIDAGDVAASRRLLLGKHGSKRDLLFTDGRRATFQQFLRHNELVWLTNELGLRSLFLKLWPQRLFRQVVDSAQFNLYMRHRFCAPSLLAVMALLGVVRLRPGPTLDAPSGMGHLSWVMSRLVPAQHLLCLDLVPSFAYSARRFFVPDAAAAIAHDLNYPMPLADGSMATIVSSDAIHYVENKALLVSEFKRVLTDDGIVIVSHMHNKLQFNPAAGSPLTPAGYLKLFEGFDVRLLPEPALLRAHLDNRAIDLATPVPMDELERAPALLAVASKSALPPSIPGIREELARAASEPAVNGLYRLRNQGDAPYFERVVPEGLAEEYPEILDTLPARADASAYTRGDLRARDELLAAGVLLDLPPGYY